MVSKKDGEFAGAMAGSVVSSLLGGMGAVPRQIPPPEENAYEEIPDTGDGDPVKAQLAVELQAVREAIPANERASFYYIIRRRAPGGPGRGKPGEQHGGLLQVVGRCDFIAGDDEWCEKSKRKIIVKYGPGEYEGTLHYSGTLKPVKDVEKWIWPEVSEEEARNFWGWGNTIKNTKEQETMETNEVQEVVKTPFDQDILNEEQKAKYLEAKTISTSKEIELEKLVESKEKKNQPTQNGVDPVVSQLQSQLEVMKNSMKEAEDRRAKEIADQRIYSEMSDLKKLILEVAQARQIPQLPPPSPFAGFMENPIFQTLIGALATRLATPAPPPPPPADPLLLLAGLKNLMPPPPPPIDMIGLAGALKSLVPQPAPVAPQPTLVELAMALKGLMPQAPQSKEPNTMEMLNFIKEFNKKSNEVSPIELIKQLKEISPAPQPMQDVLNQMQAMASIMKSMSPERGGDDEGEGEIERFARTLEVMRTLAPEIVGKEEAPKSWVTDAIKALADPVKAVAETLAKTGVIGPDQGPDPRQLALMQQQEQLRRRQIAMAQAAQAQRQGAAAASAIPQQNTTSQVNPAQAQSIPNVSPQASAQTQQTAQEVGFEMPVQNMGMPTQQTVQASPQVQPAPQAQEAAAPAEASEEDFELEGEETNENSGGVTPQSLAEFSSVITSAIEHNADQNEVFEFAQAKWPEILEMINSYESIGEFENDLAGILAGMGDQKVHVERLIEKLKSEQGKDWAASFVIKLKTGL